MLSNRDFNDLLRSMVQCEVRFLVAGGYAVMKYTEPRYTKDLDLWIATDRANAQAVYAALGDGRGDSRRGAEAQREIGRRHNACGGLSSVLVS
jgi:hypothetical protein